MCWLAQNRLVLFVDTHTARSDGGNVLSFLGLKVKNVRKQVKKHSKLNQFVNMMWTIYRFDVRKSIKCDAEVATEVSMLTG